MKKLTKDNILKQGIKSIKWFENFCKRTLPKNELTSSILISEHKFNILNYFKEFEIEKTFDDFYFELREVIDLKEKITEKEKEYNLIYKY